MTSRNELIQQVLQELQEAVDSQGLEGLVTAALEAKRVLSSFSLPSGRKDVPGLQVLEVDSVALSLYPEDAPRNMLPLVCKGGGSLLFEAASMLLWGDAGLSLELRARTVVEMLIHRQYYLQGMIDSKVMLQAVRYSLCSEESPEMTSLPSATLEAIFDADVKATCFPSSFSNVWHLYALASVLQRNIYSIYPMRNLKIRPYFNRVIRPRRCGHMPATLHIMWAGQPLTSHLFRHQYFAPVVGLEEVEVDGPPHPAAGPPSLASLPPAAKTLELLTSRPGLSYSHLGEGYSVTKSTFYRWRRQSQEHRQKVATRFSAKHFLQDGFQRTGCLVPLQQFLQMFPDISRSTYYAWKNELLGSAADPAPDPAPTEGTAMEKLPEEEAAKGPGCSSPMVSSPGMALMQQAKSYLERCIALNTVVPYRCFKSRFPGISRSTYYNWRRKALRKNPSVKPATLIEVSPAPQPVSVGEEALPPWKGEVAETVEKAISKGPTAPPKLLSHWRPLSRWQKRLRMAARKQVLSGYLPFCRFRLRYPHLSPSTFWVWKSLARGWRRGLAKPQVPAPCVGTEAEKKQQEEEAVKDMTAEKVLPGRTPTVGASLKKDPEETQGEQPSRVEAMARMEPPSKPLSIQPVMAAVSVKDSQLLMMDVPTTTFKAQAKLFLQKRFQSKSFPSYKEFSALFPLTARSTYYMWKRALYEGLTLVDG
ncbi:vertnin [Perognathus longimembris pacificus]|uniref:vertnin n=1 Tax=Perognathus longimembris pacificus TaxID=214514 RepID=UPI0020191D71|nr:vertnin [Perognathus longimembris pacificus]